MLVRRPSFFSSIVSSLPVRPRVSAQNSSCFFSGPFNNNNNNIGPVFGRVLNLKPKNHELDDLNVVSRTLKDGHFFHGYNVFKKKNQIAKFARSMSVAWLNVFIIIVWFSGHDY